MSLIALAGLVLLAALTLRHYLKTGALAPELIHGNFEHPRQLLERLPRLRQRYWVTPWLLNGHAQLVWMGLRDALAPRLRYARVDVLAMPDGGTTALHWYGLESPQDAPTLILLHGIAGTPQSMRSMVRHLHRITGWRIVLCQRRGHGGLPMTSPRFNTMGDVADFRFQLENIRHSVPRSPLYAVGVSAGSALLVRYLGEAGHLTPLRGAIAYCPGYDLRVALSRAQPFYSRYMTKALLKKFLLPHRQLLSRLPGYEDCLRARDLHELHRLLPPFSGFRDYQDFLEHCNPVTVMQNIAIPVLIINAADDPLCVVDNVREHQDMVASIPTALLVLTHRGSHCAHFSGLLASPWAYQLMGEYVMALEALKTGASESEHPFPDSLASL